MFTDLLNKLWPFQARDTVELDEPELKVSHGMRFVDADHSQRVMAKVNGDRGSGLVLRKKHTYEGGGDRLNERPLDDWLRDVPRYPPYPSAIPAAPPETILVSQADLIHEIAVGFGQTDELFQGIIMPVVRNFVDWVHLLPASKAHHHCGLGGAYRHALETARNASRLIRNEVPNPSIRKRDEAEYDKRLRAAAIIAGLLHDAGKPISDVALIDPTGQKEWNPNSRSISAWVERENIRSYYIQWRDKRYGNHELFSGRMLDRVVPDSVMEWLDAFGPGLQVWMAEAVTGTGDRNTNPIHKVVRIADESSAAKDISSDHRLSGGPLGIPMEQNVIDAMRRLLHSDIWVVNEKGSPLWVDQEQHVYLIWSRAASDIVHRLNEDKIKGVVRDPDSIGEALFETGVLVPNPYAESCQIHPMYWLIQPAELAGNRPDRPTVNVAVRLADASMLFASQANTRITRIKVFEHDPRVDKRGNSGDGSHKQKGPGHRNPVGNTEKNDDKANQSQPVIHSDAEPIDLEAIHEPAQPKTVEEKSAEGNHESSDVDALFWASVAEILGEPADTLCRPFPGEGVLAGSPALPFPIPGKSEEQSIELMEALSEAALLASDPASPLRQLHSGDGKEWLVLAADSQEASLGDEPPINKAALPEMPDTPAPHSGLTGSKNTGPAGATGASQPAGSEEKNKPTVTNNDQRKPNNTRDRGNGQRKNREDKAGSAKPAPKSSGHKRKGVTVHEGQLDIFNDSPQVEGQKYRFEIPGAVELPAALSALKEKPITQGRFIPFDEDGAVGHLKTAISSLVADIDSDTAGLREVTEFLQACSRSHPDYVTLRGSRLTLRVKKES